MEAFIPLHLAAAVAEVISAAAAAVLTTVVPVPMAAAAAAAVQAFIQLEELAPKDSKQAMAKLSLLM
jgi:pyocin large subunit-like protein